MDNISQIIKNMGVMAYIIPAVLIVYVIGIVIWMKKRKQGYEKWLSDHPDAVKIYLVTSFNAFSNNSLAGRILSSNAYPKIAYEGTKSVIYALPGTVDVELAYSYTRPGLVHKNVTKTWGPTKLSLEVEKGKTYELTFDKDEETFKFNVQR
ncbi:hypothetical protein [Parvimonas micra]|jgi:hypothetical protein|uniref:hypothetical protein n=1 Tax=Parvimonas micra TaxID=33033 RepID=UPI001E62042E|nr:hypothetical protein [Parvimonas micra]MCE3020161.1 hypothetical protein [Parvimonas micra]